MSDVAGSDEDLDDAEEEEEVPPPEDTDEPEEEPAEDKNLYMSHNRVWYVIPPCEKVGKEFVGGGCIRNYNRTCKVENAKALGEVVHDAPAYRAASLASGADGTPALSPDKVVVVRGKLKPEDPDYSFFWGMLFETSDGQTSDDHKIFRMMPKSVFSDYSKGIDSNPAFARSSLQTYKSTNGNVKAPNPIASGFAKYTGATPLKTLAPPKGKAKEESDAASKPKPKAKEPKEPKEPKPKAKEEPKKPTVQCFFKPQSAEAKNKAESSGAAEAENPGPADDGPAAKRARFEVVEKHNYVFTGDSRTLTIPVPEGATPTTAQVVATFRFD